MKDDVEKYTPLVVAIAKTMYKRQDKCELEDLIQYGYIGLLTALNLEKSDYIVPHYIRWAIIDGLRAEGVIKPRSYARSTEYYTISCDTIF